MIYIFIPDDILEVAASWNRGRWWPIKWTQAWGLAATGSSDSHDRQSIGAYLTVFPKSIHTEADLAQALRDRLCRPIKL